MAFRFSLKWLLAAMAYVAIAAAAFKQGWWIWADLLWGIAWLAWGYAVLTASFRTGATRAGAMGFALLAGAYAITLHYDASALPTARVLHLTLGMETVQRDLGYDDNPFVEPPSPFLDDPWTAEGSYWSQKVRAANSVGAIVAGFAGLWLGLLVWRQVRPRLSKGAPQFDP